MDCGFKTQKNGTAVTNILDVKELFNNAYTAKYTSGESATYTDTALNRTFTNSNVLGYPKVQSVTKEDFDKIWGSPVEGGTNISSNDLLAIPCKAPNASEYATLWIPYSNPWEDEDNLDEMFWINSDGEIHGYSEQRSGVRVVVTLTSNVKYSLAERSNSTDMVKTWDLE